MKEHLVCTAEGKGVDEYLVTRLECFQPALTMINCYSEQENVGQEEQEARWGRLTKELEVARARGDFCLLSGDLNKLVGSGRLGVEGNDPKVSRGGKLMRALLASGDWFLINGMVELVEGGPFTRQDPANGKLSCLDLFIATTNLRPYVKKLTIDSTGSLGIASTGVRKGKLVTTRSDHFPCILTLEGLPRVEQRKEKETRWNLAKKDGWNRYKELMEEECEEMEKVIENKEKEIEEVMDKIDQIQDKVKFRSFGKVSIGGNKKKAEVTLDKHDENESEEEKAKQILKLQIEDTDKHLEKIRNTKNGKVGMIYNAAKTIRGGKKAAIEATSVTDPETGKI